jgi:hypothetical protein
MLGYGSSSFHPVVARDRLRERGWGAHGSAADASTPGQDVAAPSPDATAVAADSAPDLGPVDLAPAKLVIDRTEASFTATVGCDPSDPVRFRLSNAGASVSGAAMMVFAGPFAAARDGCSGQSLAGGASCEVEVRFQPVTAGMHTGEVVLWATPGGDVRAKLAGIAVIPGSLRAAPSSVDFGNVGVSATSAPSSIGIKNIGGTALTFSGKVQISNADFLAVMDSCGETILPPSSTCEVRVAFKPTSLGAKSAILTATAAGCGASAVKTVTVSLSGSGL